ncbi:MAG: hypothetical protein ACOC1K_06085 [Nanoarchaeota archaeon]
MINLIIPVEYWKICLKCGKYYDDDSALYCNKQENCKKVGDENNRTEKINK